MVWEIFSCHTLGPLVTIKDRLNADACLDFVAGHRSKFMFLLHLSSGIHFQQNNASCYKSKVVKHSNEIFCVLKSLDLNSIEYLWDVIEREIRIFDVQLTNPNYEMP